MDFNDPVTVYTVRDPASAEIIRIALHDAGIACEIDGEYQAGFTGAIDIGIIVKAEDADRALKLIESALERD